MTSKTVQRAKTARKLGIGLIVVGLASIAWLIASLVNPIVPALPTIETLQPLQRVAWMPQPSVLLFAIAALAIVWLGATIVARQRSVFEAEARAAEDRLRRVREYGGEGRIEPYIGSPLTIDEDKEPN